MNNGTDTKLKDRKFEIWFNNHYLQFIIILLFIYTFLPVAAPILMKFGFAFPAKFIYWVYSFFCHQLPFRSWFLFGAQAYYPLTRAGLISVQSFESIFSQQSLNPGIINSIIGNSFLGYKIAICQRDFAIYFSLLLFGIFFLIQQRKIKRIPLWFWLLIGVIPIGLDGTSQYLSSISFPIIGILIRESTPLLRTITGSLFGLLTGWYIFPSMESLINNKNKTIEQDANSLL